MPDNVNHPKHYTQHPSGLEAIDICEHLTFNIGNVIKYVWRAGLKTGDPLEDLRKASWYLAREIARNKIMAKNEAALSAWAAYNAYVVLLTRTLIGKVARADPHSVLGRLCGTEGIGQWDGLLRDEIRKLEASPR